MENMTLMNGVKRYWYILAVSVLVVFLSATMTSQRQTASTLGSAAITVSTVTRSENLSQAGILQPAPAESLRTAVATVQGLISNPGVVQEVFQAAGLTAPENVNSLTSAFKIVVSNPYSAVFSVEFTDSDPDVVSKVHLALSQELQKKLTKYNLSMADQPEINAVVDDVVLTKVVVRDQLIAAASILIGLLLGLVLVALMSRGKEGGAQSRS